MSLLKIGLSAIVACFFCSVPVLSGVNEFSEKELDSLVDSRLQWLATYNSGKQDQKNCYTTGVYAQFDYDEYVYFCKSLNTKGKYSFNILTREKHSKSSILSQREISLFGSSANEFSEAKIDKMVDSRLQRLTKYQSGKPALKNCYTTGDYGQFNYDEYVYFCKNLNKKGNYSFEILSDTEHSESVSLERHNDARFRNHKLPIYNRYASERTEYGLDLMVDSRLQWLATYNSGKQDHKDCYTSGDYAQFNHDEYVYFCKSLNKKGKYSFKILSKKNHSKSAASHRVTE